MATVYADSSDGYVTKSSTSNWASARDASSGTALSTGTNSMLAIRSGHFAGRGGTTWIVTRVFMYFDTSGITSTLASATLKIRGITNNAVTVIHTVKATSAIEAAITIADFNSRIIFFSIIFKDIIIINKTVIYRIIIFFNTYNLCNI